MIARSVIRRFAAFLLLFCLATVAALALIKDRLAGYLLRLAFEQGTGTVVQFDNPRLSLLEGTASIDNIHLFLPREGPQGGVRAERVSIRVTTLDRTRRRLVLGDLRIEGTQVTSDDADSSFFRLLDFVIQPSRPGARPAFIGVELTDLSVTPPQASQSPNLILRQGEIELSWERLSLKGEALNTPDHEKTYLAAESGLATARYAEYPQLVLARATGRVSFVGGRMIIEGSEFSPVAGVSEGLSVGGYLQLRGVREYFLSLKTDLTAKSLDPLFYSAGINSPLQLERLGFSGYLTGLLSSPALKGKLELKTRASAELGLPAEWQSDQVSAELELGQGGTKARQIKIGNLIELGELDYAEGKFRVVLADRAGARIDLDYAPVQEMIEVRKVSFDNYPAQLLLSRITPFVKRDLAISLGSHLNPGSVVNGQGVFKLNTGRLGGAGNFTLGVSDLTLPGVQVKALVLDAALSEELLELRKISLISSDGTMVGNFKLVPGTSLSGELSTAGFSIGPINSDIRAPRGFFRGKVKAGGSASAPSLNAELEANFAAGELKGQTKIKAEYQGPWSDYLRGKGVLTLQGFSLKDAEQEYRAVRPLRMSLGSERLLFDEIEIFVGKQSVKLEGELNRADGWQAKLVGSWNLSSLIGDSTGVEQILGTVASQVQIRGAAKSPVFEGPLTLRDGSISFRLNDNYIGATDVSVDAVFSGGDLLIESIQGNVGDGKLQGTGRVDEILDWNRRSLRLDLQLKEVSLEPIPRLAIEADGELTILKSQQSSSQLLGDIAIQTALYRNTIDLRRIIEVLAQSVRGASSVSSQINPSQDLALDLRVYATNGILVETNVFQAELRGDLQLSGSVKRPVLEGRIEVIDGSFVLQSSSFQLVSGIASFRRSSQGLDPELEIIAESRVDAAARKEQHQVQLAVAGTLTKPRVSLTSDSGLSERDIVALLSLGSRVEEVSLIDSRESIRDLSLARLLNPRSSLTVGDRLRALTGFTDVSIESVSSLETKELVPVISARRPITDDVALTISKELSASQVSSAGILHELTPYLSLLGGWKSRPARDPDSNRGAVGVGLEYKRTFPGLSLLPPRVTGD